MAYPYFAPYQPVYPQYQPPQPPQQTTTTSGIIWVSGLNEAQMYPVAPNNAVALWEQSGKVIYLKSADATGKPSLKMFDLVERSQSGSEQQTGQDVKTIDYVSKDELNRITAALEAVKGDLETVKGDLYGMAGRKKKREVTEDDE